MAEQTFAGPAPAPALVFAERESSEPLKQLYGQNEDFVEVSYIPPSLAGAFAGGYKDNEGKIVFPRSMIANVALLAIQIPANNISIITKSPTLATINEAFAKVGKYRHTPIKSLGQFLKEVPQMIRRMPALKADLHSIQVNFEEVSIANSLNDREAKNCGLSGDSSLISTDNRSFTLNALVDQDTGCVHSNGVLLLLSFPGLRQLNLARGSVDLATLMSVKALVERATKNMPFSPDVPAESQVQFLRSVMDAKLSVEWADVINWRTEKSQIQHAIAFKVFGETDERLRLYADMLDLRRVLNREEYADMAMMLTKLGCTTPQKVVELADMLELGKFSNMDSYVAAISDKVHDVPNNKVASFLEDPDSFALRLKAESQNVIERAKAFGKHKTPAESVNCFDGGTYEDFVREYSGEAAALLAMLNSEDPIKIESWIHHVFSVASGPLKAFAFLTMIKPDKTSRFGASELDKLVVGPLSNILGLSESAFIEEFKDEHWKLEDNGTRN